MNFPVELNKAEQDILAQVINGSMTMVSPERLFATAMACKHVIERDIQGAFVECGVWRGGNSIVAAALFKLHKQDRRVYLFDTFAGMTEPDENDKVFQSGRLAKETYDLRQKDGQSTWCLASLEDVKSNFTKLDVLDSNVSFIKGDVCVTLEDYPDLPQEVAVLRLDTDWYASTKKEIEVFYPRLLRGGILIVDDYGHWAGSKQAIDEYFAANNNRPFLQYTDYTGRAGVKL